MFKSYDRMYQSVVVGLLTFLCFITALPFAWVVLTSIKPNEEIYTTNVKILPQNVTLEQYEGIIKKGDQLPHYISNTLIYSVITIFFVVLLGSMAGYALGMLHFTGAQLMITFILTLLSIPWIILIVPLLLFEFRIERWLGIEMWNTRQGLILPYIALFMPVAIWIMRGTFSGMPRELGEAARIDGAGEFVVFLRVYFPMARGGLATVALLTFIDVWNEVLMAASLAFDPKVANINIGLRILADEGQSFAFGTLSAAIVLAMIPTLLVFIVLQRYYVRGISEGALAGF